MTPPEPLIGVDELARRLGCTKDEVRRKARSGDLPALRFGGRWRFDWTEVLASLRHQPDRTAA